MSGETKGLTPDDFKSDLSCFRMGSGEVQACATCGRFLRRRSPCPIGLIARARLPQTPNQEMDHGDE